MNVAEIRGLNKKYPGFALKDVSFDVEKGKITGLIGRNGAGKTTVIKSMLNLIHPDSGEIRCFGQDLRENEAGIKKRIGFSAGAVNQYPRKKIREIAGVISGFYDNWDAGIYEKYLRLFKLDENKAPRELSEGMKVKFSLLAALSHKAELLVLDEPTGALDPFSRDEVLDILTGLKDEGISVFYSTHILSDLEKCADNLIYLKQGTIAATLPKKEFTERFSQSGETLEATFLRLEREAIR